MALPCSTLSVLRCRPFREWTSSKKDIYPKGCFKDYLKGTSVAAFDFNELSTIFESNVSYLLPALKPCVLHGSFPIRVNSDTPIDSAHHDNTS